VAATAFSLIGRISMQGVPSALKEVEGLEDAVKKVSKELGKLGSNLVKTGSYLTKNVTAPMAAATAAIGLLSIKTGEYAGKLSSLQQETGLTTDTLQEYQHVARAAGGSSDALFATITALSNKLPEIAQGTGKSAEALDKLGIRVTNADGSFRDMNDLFPEIISKLQGVDDVTTRNQIAFDIFGKKSKEVASFLGMSAAEMSNTRKEAHDLGLVMGEKALKQADDFRKGMETLKAQLSMAGMEVANKLIPILNDTFIPLVQSTLIPTLKTATDVVGGLAKAFSVMPKDLQEVTFLMGGVVSAAGPIALVVGKILLSLKTVVPVLAGLGVKIGAVSAGATGAGAAMAGFAATILLPIAAVASLGNAIRVAIRDFGTLARLKREAKEDDAFIQEAHRLSKTTAEARKLKEEYEKLKDKPDFNPAELEKLTKAYEDAAIAHRNLNRERAGQGKMTDEEVEAFRKKSRGIKEVSAEETRMTEYAKAQAKERAKAYAEEAARRKKELNGAVKDYEDKYENMFLSEVELVEKERDLEVQRLMALGATEAQLFDVRKYFNKKSEDLIAESDEKKRKEDKDKAEKERADQKKKYDEDVKWQEKLISKRLEADSRELAFVDVLYQDELKATKDSMASQMSIHKYYAQEKLDLRRKMADKQLEIMDMEYKDALEKAEKDGVDLSKVHEYYAYERFKIKKDVADEEYKVERDLTQKEEAETNRRISLAQKWMDGVSSIVSKLGNVFNQYYSNLTKIEDRAYKEKKEKIEADAENEIITEEEKTAQLKALDEEHEAKKLAIQREQAKRQKAISLFSIVTDTAAAVMRALKDFGPVVGGIMAGVVAGLGAAQFALVASEPEPFFDGGLIKGSQEGIHAQIGERNQDEVVFPLQTGIDKIVEGLNASNGGSQTTNYTVNVNVGSFIGDRKSIQDLGKKIREVIISEDRRTGVSYATA